MSSAAKAPDSPRCPEPACPSRPASPSPPEVCNIFFENGNKVPADINNQILEALEKLEKQIGKKLGDPANPLLVSVRSGAKFSMPGMMNTILNLGLNDKTVEGLAKLSGNAWFAHDSYRRFIQMFGEVALNIDMEKFDHIFDERKHKAKVKLDTDLSDTPTWSPSLSSTRRWSRKRPAKPFPQDAREQLSMSQRRLVFGSWWNPKAAYYRKMEKIPDEIGTAAQCAGDGASAIWALLRRQESASRAIPPPARKRSTANS